MSRISWHRPARIPPPALPTERVVIAPPPQLPPQSGGSAWLSTLLPMLSSISIAGYMIAYRKALLTVLAVGIVVLSVGVTAVVRGQMRSASRRNRERQRTRYLDHLSTVKESARAVAAAQRAAAAWQWPSPERLWAIAQARRRVWERRPADPDFMHVRVGSGRGPLAAPLQLNTRIDPTVEYDPELKNAADRVVEMYGTVGGQPATVDLHRAGVVSIIGPRELTQATCRALIGQVTVLHAPDDVLMMVSTGGDDEAWTWTTWLPHTRDPEARDVARNSLVATGYEGLEDAVERELSRALTEKSQQQNRVLARANTRPSRSVVVVIDSFHPASPWARSPLARRLVEAAGPETGITVVALVRDAAEEPSRVDVRIGFSDHDRLYLQPRQPELAGPVVEAVADQCPVELSEATARAVAPLMLTEEQTDTLDSTVSLSQILGASDLANFDPRDVWVQPGDDKVLRAPLGVASDGTYLTLDLKESAQGGMGPHGLVVGATGSGKSELLRTLLTGLTMTHSPDLLSMVLVDFKGGATFAGMTELPHVAGLITNLADDLALVDRVRDALMGEQQRRQRLLRDAGNVDSLREYQAKQAAGGVDVNGRPLEPLPYLLVIVDEFGELLSLRPDFIHLFVQIGRVGRSLGIHLLLATQRLEEGRLRGLESHLSYRICLRTFSAAESRTVIGTPDAYYLPQLPGSAFLKVGESVYERFRVAHVSAPYQEAGEAPGDEPPDRAAEIAVLGLREAPGPDMPEEPAESARPTPIVPGGRTQMQVMVGQLRQFGQPVHQVWLPPMPAAIPLDLLLGPLIVQDDRGLQSSMWSPGGSLRIPVGVVDLPQNQEQRPLFLDFAQMNPHLLLVGAPQSGKSTFLRTLIVSAMLTHTPREMQFYCLDYGGGTLHSVAGAPHVSGVVARGETPRATRVFNEIQQLISKREQLFRDKGIRSIADFRDLRDSGDIDASAADVFLIIDGWGVLRNEVPDADAFALDIAARGPGVGVHLVMAANRWGDIRMNLRDSVSTRLELRLNDASESEVNRQVSRLLPPGVPGRGLAPPGLLFQTALPRLDGGNMIAGLGDAQDEVLSKIITAWQGESAPPIRLLPGKIFLADVPEARKAPSGDGVAVAIGEQDLAPVFLSLTGPDQHCAVIGDGGAGKSTFIRTWMAGLAAQYPPQQLRFMVVDYRRALIDAVPAPYIGAYAGDAEATQAYSEQLAAKLAERLPPRDISPRDLRRRNWWTGPEFYLVVDDYDMVAVPGRPSPLQPLIDYIPHSREIGLHIVVARRSGGMARALTTDPVISRIRELGSAALILSSDAREGVLFGDQRGAEMPPGRGVLVRRRQEKALVQVLIGDDLLEEDID
ncbi:MAG TPA: type VII secretion protein EccCa [Streptosporangiaceae bacterium]|nr:type VII secretion protein EccCa [Streptosporangiaceae bacterium]